MISGFKEGYILGKLDLNRPKTNYSKLNEDFLSYGGYVSVFPRRV